ncbi:MAG: hypothetical protein AAF570_04830 [Bacteroidota bacterium]
MNFRNSKLVRDALNGDLPTINVSVSIPAAVLAEMALAAFVAGVLLMLAAQAIK